MIQGCQGFFILTEDESSLNIVTLDQVKDLPKTKKVRLFFGVKKVMCFGSELYL